MFGWKAKPVGQPHSVIDIDTELQGPLKSRGYMEIRGRVIGDLVHEGTLVVAAEGYCLGGIHASELIICGEVRGDVSVSGKLRIKSGGILVGDALCGSLAVEPGATFNGRNRVEASVQPAYTGPTYAKLMPGTLEPAVADRGSALRILREPVDGPALDIMEMEPVAATTEPAAAFEPVAAAMPESAAEPEATEPSPPEAAEDEVVAFHGPFRGGSRFGRTMNPPAVNH